MPALIRIFEGTNEINRMLTIDMLMKRAMKGSIDLMTPAMAVQKELMAIPDFGASDDGGVFAKEKKALANLKKSGIDGCRFGCSKVHDETFRRAGSPYEPCRHAH